jgi:hypothetical protein
MLSESKITTLASYEIIILLEKEQASVYKIR